MTFVIYFWTTVLGFKIFWRQSIIITVSVVRMCMFQLTITSVSTACWGRGGWKYVTNLPATTTSAINFFGTLPSFPPSFTWLFYWRKKHPSRRRLLINAVSFLKINFSEQRHRWLSIPSLHIRTCSHANLHNKHDISTQLSILCSSLPNNSYISELSH